MDLFSERNFFKKTLLIILGVVFGAEIIVMLFLDKISWPSRLVEAVADSFVLVFILAPILYYLIVRSISVRVLIQEKAMQKLRAGEERFSAVSDATPDIILLYSRTGRILYANPATERLLGFPLSEVEGRHASRFIHRGDWKAVNDSLHALLDGAGPLFITIRLLKKDGSHCNMEVCGFSMGEGKERYIGTILRDITKRRKAQREMEEYRDLLEKLLAERTDHLEKLLDFSKHLTSTTDTPILLRKCTQLTMDLLGLDFSTIMLLSEDKSSLVLRDTIGFPESMVNTFTLLKGQGISSWVVENHAPATVVEFAEESRFEAPQVIFEKGITSAICVPMMIANEVFGVLIGHTNDRREFEEWEITLYQNFASQAAVALDNANHLKNLEESEKKFRSFFENTSDPLFIYSMDGSLLEVNRAACERLGYTRKELLQMPPQELVAPEYAAMVQTRIEIVKNAKQAIFESAHKTKDGDIIPIELNCRLIDYKDEPAIIGVARDILDRKRAEAALRESEERYRDLFESASDLILILQPDGHFLYVNRAWRERLGYSEEEARDLSINDILEPEFVASWEKIFKKVLADGKVDAIDISFVTRDGREVMAEGTANCKYEEGSPVYCRCIFRDVTAKRKLELEVQKTEKLESIGVLAGGIAHDFNNLLTAILGNISLAKIMVEKENPVFERLVECEKASQRARGLTQQLLTFSKGGAPVTMVASIRDLIKDSASFMLAGSKTTCLYDMADDLWRVEIDTGQISQVIQNLVKNADQAMPDGGRIRIKAQNVALGAGDGLSLEAGKYVKLWIIDTGPGIPIEKLPQVFDPYFTTKPDGSGLGLAIAYSIMKRHNGLVTVDSRDKMGATFCLYLPAVDKAESVVALEKMQEAHVGQGLILVMDDEEIVCQVAVRMLRHLGYDSETAADGETAVSLYSRAREENRPFDAVIMDLTIPGGMGGEAALKKMLEIDPDVKAVVSSGYANDPVMADYQAFGFQAVVPKPYKIQELAMALEKVLKEKPS